MIDGRQITKKSATANVSPVTNVVNFPAHPSTWNPVGALIRRIRVCQVKMKQGRVHGRNMDGWVGAVMQKLLTIPKCNGRMDRPTDGLKTQT